MKEVAGRMEDLKTVFTERLPSPNHLNIPFWLKSNLTVEEAAAYSGVGRNKLRELSDDENCSFVLWVGNKRLIKRRLLDEFLDSMYSV
jgi:excisionase family DNA binding protein